MPLPFHNQYRITIIEAILIPLQRIVMNIFPYSFIAFLIADNMTVWQRSFHDHIIRDEKDYLKIWQYIDENPSKWEQDCFYRDKDREEAILI